MKNPIYSHRLLEAGDNKALIYSLLANCRAPNLDPEDYLTEVIKRLPRNVTPEQYAELPPPASPPMAWSMLIRQPKQINSPSNHRPIEATAWG